jgi:hypothetical protein
MTLRRAPFALVVVAILLAIGSAPAASAEPVSDASLGYTLNVPAGWQRIPDAALRQNFAGVTKPGMPAPNFVAAFQPRRNASSFDYPYVLVQIHDYGNGISLASVSRSDVDDIVSKLTGLKPEQFKRAMSDEVAPLFQDASIERPTVTTSPPGFVTDINLRVAGRGAVRGRSCALLGRTNVAFIHFYAREADWASNARTLEGLVTSFRRTPGQSITMGQSTMTTGGKTLSNGFDWTRVWSKALAGGILGAAGAMVGRAVNRRKNVEP